MTSKSWFTEFTVICLIVSVTGQCLQRGCDQAGLFFQDLKLDMLVSEKHSLSWTSSDISTQPMTPKSDLSGCVANTEFVVCQYFPEAAKHILLAAFDVDTGHRRMFLDSLINPGMPVITNYSAIISSNATHVAIYCPNYKYSYIQALPYPYQYGSLAPVLLDNNMVLIVGNMSGHFSVWQYQKKGQSDLKLISTFNITSDGMGDCPWLTMNDLASRGNRLYYSSVNSNKDNPAGIVAFDVLKDGSAKLAWVYSEGNSQSGGNKLDTICYFDPKSIRSGFWPPMDIATQMLATPEGLVVMTSPLTVIKYFDKGDHGEEVVSPAFGVHYMAYSPRKSSDKDGMVWMSGWNYFPDLQQEIVGLNSSNIKPIVLDSLDVLKVGAMNITSRIASFKHPEDSYKRILVFGVVVSNSISDIYDKNVYSLLIAMETSDQSTGTPNVLWTYRLPSSANEQNEPLGREEESNYFVRGQILAVKDKLVFYMSDGTTGRVYALK